MPFQNPIVAGTALVRAAVKSPDYVPGSAGWSINRDGTAEFSDAIVRGKLESGTLQVVSGTDIPADLVTYYQSHGETILSAVITKSLTGPDYGYQGVIDPGPVFGITMVHGTYDGSVLAEIYREWRAGGTGHIYYAWHGNTSARLRMFSDYVSDPAGPGSSYVSIDDNIVPVSRAYVDIDRVAGSTISGTYVNYPGTSSTSFKKHYWISGVEVGIRTSLYTDVGNTLVRFGVNINGMDIDICKVLLNVANVHTPVSGTRRVFAGGAIPFPSGLHEGLYTVQARWRRVFGTGTVICTADDFMHVTVKEITGVP